MIPLGVLASSRVAAGSTYATEVAADSPIAWWRLDESSGTTMADSANGYDGTYINTPTLGATSLLAQGGGTAVAWSGSDEHATVAHNSALNGSGAFTLECWVKINNAGDDVRPTIITKTGVSPFTYGQWSVWYDNRISQGSPQRLRFVYGSGDLGNGLDWAGAATAAALASGGHLVCTAQGSGAGKTVTIYWNGEVKATQSATVTWKSDNTEPVYIAAANGSWNLDGTLDEVAIYASELSSTRVSAHYSAGS